MESETLLQCLPSLSDHQGLKTAHQLRSHNQPDRDPIATLSEVFADVATDAGVTGFACAHFTPSDKPVLWIQDRLSLREAGRPYLAGLPVAVPIVHVTVSKPADVLWSMEEGLRCAGLSAVLGEVWGDPGVLDFTATKRLALRSEAQRLPTWLIRRAASPNLSAARMRWQVASLPSLGVTHDMRAPGAPQWRATLFRARWQAPGSWVVRHDAQGLHFDHPTLHDAPQVDQAASGP